MLEKALIQNAIHHVMAKEGPLIFNHKRNKIFDYIQKNTEEYFTDLKYLFIKLKKISILIDKYEKLFGQSVIINHDYIEYQKHLLKLNNISPEEFSPFLRSEVTLNDETSMRNTYKKNIKILEFYYITLKSKKIHLDNEKVYSK